MNGKVPPPRHRKDQSRADPRDISPSLRIEHSKRDEDQHRHPWKTEVRVGEQCEQQGTGQPAAPGQRIQHPEQFNHSHGCRQRDRRVQMEGERHHPMKTLKVGIASYEDMKARTMAIAKGELRPGRDEPKVWFNSAESFGKILSNKNRALLSTIVHARPGSLGELAVLTGRKKSNLSRTLKTLESFGLVRLKRGERGRLIPEVPYDEISLVVPLVSHPGKEPKAA